MGDTDDEIFEGGVRRQLSGYRWEVLTFLNSAMTSTTAHALTEAPSLRNSQYFTSNLIPMPSRKADTDKPQSISMIPISLSNPGMVSSLECTK